MDTTSAVPVTRQPNVSKPALSVSSPLPVNQSSKASPTGVAERSPERYYPDFRNLPVTAIAEEDKSALEELPDDNPDYALQRDSFLDSDVRMDKVNNEGSGASLRSYSVPNATTFTDYLSGYYNKSSDVNSGDTDYPNNSGVDAYFNTSSVWEWLLRRNQTQHISQRQQSWTNYSSEFVANLSATSGHESSGSGTGGKEVVGANWTSWSPSVFLWPAETTTRSSGVVPNFTWSDDAQSVTGYLFDYVTGVPDGGFSSGVGGELNNVTGAVSGCHGGLQCLLDLYGHDDGEGASRITVEGGDPKYNWWFLLVLLFMAAGGLGNVLVCLAICLERRLQNVTNYFLLSLAVADLLVSLVVMPFGIVVGFLGYWPFGAAMCNVYVTCDVLSCSSSIMHMCFISMGRYLGIRNPLKTRNNSKKAVVVKMVLVWLLSMVITSPITLLGITDSANIVPEPRSCAINNQFFFIFGSLFAFYIPMVIMVIAYVLTVQLLRKQAKFDDAHQARRLHLTSRRSKMRPGEPDLQEPLRGKSQQQRDPNSFRGGGSGNRRERTSSDSRGKSTSTPTSPSDGGPPTNNGHIVFPQYPNRLNQQFHERHNHDVCECGTQTPSSLLDRGQNTLSCPSLSKVSHSRRIHDSGNGNGRLEDYGVRKNDDDESASVRGGSGKQFRFPLKRAASSVHFKFLPNRRRSVKSISSVATEQKASKVLGLVFFAFVICWTPFFLLNIIFAACPSCPVSERIVNTSLWLGYVSSTINPVIYTIFNRTFKEAFARLLTCRCVGNRRRHWYGRSGIGGAAYFSAADSLAQAPIKLVGCIRTSSYPPSSYSEGSETTC